MSGKKEKERDVIEDAVIFEKDFPEFPDLSLNEAVCEENGLAPVNALPLILSFDDKTRTENKKDATYAAQDKSADSENTNLEKEETLKTDIRKPASSPNQVEVESPKKLLETTPTHRQEMSKEESSLSSAAIERFRIARSTRVMPRRGREGGGT